MNPESIVPRTIINEENDIDPIDVPYEIDIPFIIMPKSDPKEPFIVKQHPDPIEPNINNVSNPLIFDSFDSKLIVDIDLNKNLYS